MTDKPTIYTHLSDAITGLRVVANLHQFNPERPDSENRCTCFQCSRAQNALRCVEDALRLLQVPR